MPKTIKKAYFDFLKTEISSWQDAHLIDDNQAQKLLGHYRARDALPLMNWILSLLAALLIGGGIILVIAHNWHEINRLTRAIIALSPLIMIQGICLWLFYRGKNRCLVGESCAILLAAAQGCAIALVSQTYHLYGQLSQFFLLWFFMAFTAAIVMRSRSLFIIAMLLLSGYASANYHWYSHSIWQWRDTTHLVILSIAGFYVFTLGGIFERWAYLLTLPIALGNSFHGFGQAWPLIAGCYYSLGLFSAKHWWRNPLHTLGVVGILTTLIMILFENIRMPHRLDDILVIVIFALICLCCLIALWHKDKRLFYSLSTQVLLATLLCYLLLLKLGSADSATQGTIYFLTRTFCLLAGLLMTYAGLKEDYLIKVNTGLVIICALIIDVFFDRHWSLVMRGVGFVICGLLLFVVNLYFMRRKKS